jgi:hypothetical protein
MTTSSIVTFVALLFLGMLALFGAGRYLGRRVRARNPEATDVGGGLIDTSVLGLLGLMLAFTFSGAAERFDARRILIVQETNAIGTAYLRLDLLPAAAQQQLRSDFRRYAESRLAFYRSLPDRVRARAIAAESERLQRGIWSQAVAAAQELNKPAPMTLVLSSLNEMIDITTTRAMSLIMHPPLVIYALLGVLSLTCAMLAGFGTSAQSKPSILHLVAFPIVLTLTIYVTLDLEYPRQGLIRVDAADEVLIAVRKSMGN